MFDFDRFLSPTEVNPFFPVLRNQLFTPFTFAGDDEPSQVYVDRDALLNSESGQVLGTVGKFYKLITNAEVAEIFAHAFSDLPIESMTDHMNWKENRWQRDFILNGDVFNINFGGEVLQTKVSIFNGYDGKSAVGFTVSAYRGNGQVTYLNNMFTQTYTHVQRELVDRIREDFQKKLELFKNTVSMLSRMDASEFTAEQFESFVRGQIRQGERDRNGFLTERQADAILESYEGYITRLGVRRTRFGAYTVLSAIAMERDGRGGSSAIFTAGFKRMEKLVTNFFADAPEDLFTI